MRARVRARVRRPSRPWWARALNRALALALALILALALPLPEP